jgi:Replication protein P
MKKISYVLNKPFVYKEDLMNNDSTLNDQAAELVDNLFKVLIIHVKYFENNHIKNQDEFLSIKREWVKTFIVNKMTEDKIKIGVSKIRQSTKIFNDITPGEFLALCSANVEDFGLPSIDEAYAQACKNSHPSALNRWEGVHDAVRLAARDTGSYELTSLPRDKSFPIFKRNYDNYVQKVMTKQPLKALDKAIEHKPDSTYSKSKLSVSKQALADLYKSLGK